MVRHALKTRQKEAQGTGAPHRVPKKLGRDMGPTSRPFDLQAYFFASLLVFYEKNDVANILAPFELRKDPKFQITQKWRISSFVELKTRHKGLDGKFPKSTLWWKLLL
jgi:hypothetical protein